MNRKIVISRAAWLEQAVWRGKVNFQPEITRGMNQLHTISAKGIEAVVDKYNPRLGLHTRGLRGVQKLMKQSLEESGLNWVTDISSNRTVAVLFRVYQDYEV